MFSRCGYCEPREPIDYTSLLGGFDLPSLFSNEEVRKLNKKGIKNPNCQNKPDDASQPSLLLEEKSKDMIELAKLILINHAKSSGENKFKALGASVSYLGQRQNEYIDTAKLRELVTSDIIIKVTKKGKMWEDLRVRFEKDGE